MSVTVPAGELDALRLLIAGHTHTEAAHALYVQPATARKRTQRLRERTGARNDLQAMGRLMRAGLLSTEEVGVLAG